MQIEKKECKHISHVLQESMQATTRKDAPKLKDLSDHTIHSSCHYQDVGSITIAVMLYTLSKIIERGDYKKITNWLSLVKKFNNELELARKLILQQQVNKYQSHIKKARQILESQSIQIKPYIQSVLKKAAINKGFKLYQHGLSMEQTAKLLGISQWELSGYIGHKQHHFETKQDQTISVKKRAQLAMEFFS